MHNNPVQLVLREAIDVWGDHVEDAILISLGTGNAPDTAFAGNAPQIVKKLKEIATQTEETANVFLGGEGRSMAQKGRYSRFNVPNIAQIGLEEWREKGKITSLTENYVDNEETRPKIEACIEKLSEIAAKGTF